MTERLSNCLCALHFFRATSAREKIIKQIIYQALEKLLKTRYSKKKIRKKVDDLAEPGYLAIGDLGTVERPS
jgi:hypothetical protein